MNIFETPTSCVGQGTATPSLTENNSSGDCIYDELRLVDTLYDDAYRNNRSHYITTISISGGHFFC